MVGTRYKNGNPLLSYIISIVFVLLNYWIYTPLKMSQYTFTELSLLNGTTFDISYACAQRANTFLHNVPPIRYLPINPYPQSTKMQLDMRRKCEIFKYAGSGSSQQTNSLSKKQQFASLVNNTGTRTIVTVDISSGRQQINAGPRGTQYTCTQDRTLPTLTTACDVPGPVQILTYDPSVNLYNYSYQINTRVFPDGSNEDDLLGMNSTS